MRAFGSHRFWYRLLLRCYPAGFREEYQDPMERQFAEEYREARGWAAKAALWGHSILDVAVSAPAITIEEIGQDLRFAIRQYRKRPGYTVLSTAALALALGVCTGVFSVLEATLWRELPFRHGERIVELKAAPVGALAGKKAFEDWAAGRPYLEELAAHGVAEMNLSLGERTSRVRVAETSANFFRVTGGGIDRGRDFRADNDSPAMRSVAVVSYGWWLENMGGDPAAIGRAILLNGEPFQLIGVAAKGFDYPARATVWIPTAFAVESIPKQRASVYITIGKLREGWTLDRADRVYRQDAGRNEKGKAVEVAGWVRENPRLVSLREELAGKTGAAAVILALAVCLVLLTASANVAMLLTAQAQERSEEFSLRTALGAKSGRLLQQLITEACALTLVSAGLGLTIAWVTAQVAAAAAAPSLSAQSYAPLDSRALAFAAAVAAVTGLFFGVVPYWIAGRLRWREGTVRQRAQGPDIAMGRTRTFLLGTQAATSLALLAAAVGMNQSFRAMIERDMGYTPEQGRR